MKLITTATLSFLCLVTVWADGDKETFPFVGEVTAEHLNVRAFPKADNTSPIMAVIPEGSRVTVTGISGDFYEILPIKGAWAWVSSRMVNISGDNATVKSTTSLRIDSRTNATKIGLVEAGEMLTVLEQRAGWAKVVAPDSMRLYTAKKYIKFAGASSGPLPAKKSVRDEFETSKTSAPRTSDSAAREMLKQAETLITEQEGLISQKRIDEVSFEPIAGAYEQAASLAADPGLRKTAEDSARIYRKFQHMLVGIKAMKQSAEVIARELEKLTGEAKATQQKMAGLKFTGTVDTVGALLLNRPGSHKLVRDGKIVCFLRTKDGDEATRQKLSRFYEYYVGVSGTETQAEGWEGIPVVIVDDVIKLNPESAATSETTSEKTKTPDY
jgi:hypothetical protein